MPFGSSRIPRPFATNVRAIVKWYNPTKGFGFVSPDDGSPDVFLHVSVVEQAGLQSLGEGSILVCDLADGQKGAQVSAIHSVEAGSAPAQRRAVVRDPDPGIPARSSVTTMIMASAPGQAVVEPLKAL